jgi:hypothetical protein
LAGTGVGAGGTLGAAATASNDEGTNNARVRREAAVFMGCTFIVYGLQTWKPLDPLDTPSVKPIFQRTL